MRRRLAEQESPPGNPLDELQERRRLLLHELKDRSLWFVRARWWVPPLIWAGLLWAYFLGVRAPYLAILAVSGFVLLYNAFFQRWHRRFVRETALRTEDRLRAFTRWQVSLDFAALFAFVHFTGGSSSPFVFFFIFHVIFASILLKHSTAHAFALVAALGMGLLSLAESLQWIPHRPLLYRDRATISLTEGALPLMVRWGFFAASVLLSSFVTTSIMEMVRRRILRLADLSEAVQVLNNRLRSLHNISRSIVSSRRLQTVLDLVCRELAAVLGVQGVSVKLLSEDGARLRYVASQGLPARFAPGRELEVAQSPINRQIIEGEPFATGRVTQTELFQLGEEFASAHVQSVLFVPLRHEDRVIGILGAYCRDPDFFRSDDIEFLQLAAGLVAIALENAGAYEAVETAGRERERFTFRVAHNLRAPLAAVVSMLDVLGGGYIGPLNDTQKEYLGRAERRVRGLSHFIDELLQLAESQAPRRSLLLEDVDLRALAGKVERTFRDRAAESGIRFEVTLPAALPPVPGDPGRLQLLIENLVSNALKYTRSGGKVILEIRETADGKIGLEVRDTGIGIPAAAQSRIFTEFFRAENAKSCDSAGTGLGLVIAREIVEQHGGGIRFESAEGRGTSFFVTLPMASAEGTSR